MKKLALGIGAFVFGGLLAAACGGLYPHGSGVIQLNDGTEIRCAEIRRLDDWVKCVDTNQSFPREQVRMVDFDDDTE